MTKKHFVAMARKFRALLEATDSPECAAGIILSVHAFCAVAADCNDRFDEDRFKAAAGCDDWNGRMSSTELATGLVALP